MRHPAFRTIVSVGVLLFFEIPANAINIATASIGNPGNPADTRYIDSAHPSGVGAVAQSFNIGKTEVTNAQYVALLKAVAASDPYGLYSTNMGIDTRGGIVRAGVSGSFTYAVRAPALSGAYTYDNKPVVFVSSGNAMRFANWLNNGQPTGVEDATTTEGGAYTLNGATTDAALATVTRNSGARWWLPNESEWYKAAYHKNDGVTGDYWDYPTGTNTVPNNNKPSADTGNSVNFFGSTYTTGNSSYPMTDAGAYTLSDSPYGTFDQGGNVWEWNETLFSGSLRGIRGGSWGDHASVLRASVWDGADSSGADSLVGFRVASIPRLAPDFNGDGKVDAADYVTWRKYDVSQAGYITWRANFNAAAASGLAFGVAIPEPTEWILLLVIGAWAAVLRQPRLRMERTSAAAGCMAVVSSCREMSG